MKNQNENTLSYILSLTKQLVVIPSTSDNPQGLFDALNLAKKELEGDFQIEEFKDKNGALSLLIHNGSKGTRKFQVILNAHLDVVSGQPEQYNPIEKDGRLYGRGVYDMKGATAAMIKVFKDCASDIPYPLALQIVTDEEIGKVVNGTAYQIEKGVRADFIITGEHSDFTIKNRSRGKLWMSIKTKGKTGHGAYPWVGENALWKMHEVLHTLQSHYPTPKEKTWEPTLHLAKIETNNNEFNKIPDQATALLDIRYPWTNKERIVKELESILPQDVEMEIFSNEPAVDVPPDNYYITHLEQAIKDVLGKQSEIVTTYASSDIRFYSAVGCDGIEFGVSGEHQHGDNEWVDIKSLEQYYDILKEFLFSLK